MERSLSLFVLGVDVCSGCQQLSDACEKAPSDCVVESSVVRFVSDVDLSSFLDEGSDNKGADVLLFCFLYDSMKDILGQEGIDGLSFKENISKVLPD
jgi:hypothetical protein